MNTYVIDGFIRTKTLGPEDKTLRYHGVAYETRGTLIRAYELSDGSFIVAKNGKQLDAFPSHTKQGRAIKQLWAEKYGTESLSYQYHMN